MIQLDIKRHGSAKMICLDLISRIISLFKQRWSFLMKQIAWQKSWVESDTVCPVVADYHTNRREWQWLLIISGKFSTSWQSGIYSVLEKETYEMFYALLFNYENSLLQFEFFQFSVTFRLYMQYQADKIVLDWILLLDQNALTFAQKQAENMTYEHAKLVPFFFLFCVY